MAAFAAMALVAGTWLAYGSAPARAVVGQSTFAIDPAVAILTAGGPGEVVGSNCTGVLISSTEIMTAGHCVEDKKFALLGSTYAYDPAATKVTITGARTWATDPALGVVSITLAVTGMRPASVGTTPVSPASGVPC